MNEKNKSKIKWFTRLSKGFDSNSPKSIDSDSSASDTTEPAQRSRCPCCRSTLTFPPCYQVVRCKRCRVKIFLQGKEPPADVTPLSRAKTEIIVNGDPSQACSTLCKLLYDSFSCQQVLNISFLSKDRKSVNLVELQNFFRLVNSFPSGKPYHSILCGVNELLSNYDALADYKEIHWLIILLEIPTLRACLKPQVPKKMAPAMRSINYSIAKRLIGYLGNIDEVRSKLVSRWLSQLPTEVYLRKLEFVNLYITFQMTRFIDASTFGSSSKILEKDDVNYKENLSNEPLSRSETRALVNKMNRVPSTKGPQIKLSFYGNDWHLQTASKTLSLFYSANCGNSIMRQKVAAHSFYNPLTDLIDSKQDFESWQRGSEFVPLTFPQEGDYRSVVQYLQASSSALSYGLQSSLSKGAAHSVGFTFCSYPFLLSLATKIAILEYEAKSQMKRQGEQTFLASLDNKSAVVDFHFTVRARRQFLLSDSLKSISHRQALLKKPLRVEFVGEAGVDAGGLKKEWFLILTEELFKPGRGLFDYVEESRLFWFNSSATKQMELFYLVGVVLGLAMYNSTILDLKLPKALYKKLLGETIGLPDFAQLYPQTGFGLKQLFEMQSNQEIEALGLTFAVSVRTRDDKIKEVKLKENGDRVAVTLKNREEYVKRYIEYHLSHAVSAQYQSFKTGFFNVIGGRALSLFSSEEVELILTGENDEDRRLDVSLLKSEATYSGWPDNSIAADSQHASWLWEWVDAAEKSHQKLFLRFVSGSGRLPATGRLKLKITKLSAAGSASLPTAHTCFNELCVYEYTSKEQLWQKLQYAIENSQVFEIE